MGVKIIVLNASGNLSPYLELLKGSAKAIVKNVKLKMPLGDIDIIIKESDYPSSLEAQGGVGGYCPSAHFVQISVDPRNLKFRKKALEFLARTLSHELHHAVRQQRGIDLQNGTFLECMLSEGLADYFAFEITGKIPIWASSLDGEGLRSLQKKIRPNLNKEIGDQVYSDWFIVGSEKKKIPKLAGYSLGFDMVKKYIDSHPQESAESLIDASVEIFNK